LLVQLRFHIFCSSIYLPFPCNNGNTILVNSPSSHRIESIRITLRVWFRFCLYMSKCWLYLFIYRRIIKWRKNLLLKYIICPHIFTSHSSTGITSNTTDVSLYL
jgi:hypothetical protein